MRYTSIKRFDYLVALGFNAGTYFVDIVVLPDTRVLQWRPHSISSLEVNYNSVVICWKLHCGYRIERKV